jgi:hypothetical protein
LPTIPGREYAAPAKLAETEGESSNLLFETLADWNHQLEKEGINFEEPAQ